MTELAVDGHRHEGKYTEIEVDDRQVYETKITMPQILHYFWSDALAGEERCVHDEESKTNCEYAI